MKIIKTTPEEFLKMECLLSTGRGLGCAESIGGAKTLFLANYDPALVYQFTQTTPKQIDATPTITVYRFDLEDGNGGMVETSNRDISLGSNLKEVTGDFSWNNLTPEDQLQIDELTSGKFWAWVEDYNGNVIMYGVENGCWFPTVVGGTGTAKTDRSGYTLSIMARERLTAPFNVPYTSFPFDTLADVTVDPPYPVVV